MAEKIEIIISAKDQFSGAFRSLGGRIVAINQALQLAQQVLRPLVGGLNQVLETTDRFKRMEITLTAMSGSLGQARREMEFIRQAAKQTPATIATLTDSFVKLKSTGIEETERTLLALTDAVAAFGGSDQDLKLATLAFQQMAGKGVVSMEELRRQLGERIPTAIQILAREMDLTLPELFKAVESGSVDSREAIRAMTRGFEKDFSGASARLMKIWTGVTSNLTDAWDQFARALGESGVNEFFIKLGSVAIRTLNMITDAIKPNDLETMKGLGSEINKITKEIALSEGKIKVWEARFFSSQDTIDTEKIKVNQLNLVLFDLRNKIKELEDKGFEEALKGATKEADNLTKSLEGVKEVLIPSTFKIHENVKALNLSGEATQNLVIQINNLKKAKRQETEAIIPSTFEILENVAALNLGGEATQELVIQVNNLKEAIKKEIEVLIPSTFEIHENVKALNLSGEATREVVIQVNKLKEAIKKETEAIIPSTFEVHENVAAMNIAGEAALEYRIELNKLTDSTIEFKDETKEAADELNEFLNAQGQRIASQVTGVSGAIAGAQAGAAAGPGGMAFGAIVGLLTDFLLENEKFKEFIGELNRILAELIAPLLEPLVEMLSSFLPLLVALQPIFDLLGRAVSALVQPTIAVNAGLRRLDNAFNNSKATFQPLLDDLSSGLRSVKNATLAILAPLRSIEQPLIDLKNGVDVLADVIRNWNPFSRGGGGNPFNFASRTGGVASAVESVVGAVAGVFGLHDGGLIGQQDLLRVPGTRSDEGFIFAQAGETVIPRDGNAGGSTFHFNIKAISPRETANELRETIQEMQALGLLGAI